MNYPSAPTSFDSSGSFGGGNPLVAATSSFSSVPGGIAHTVTADMMSPGVVQPSMSTTSTSSSRKRRFDSISTVQTSLPFLCPPGHNAFSASSPSGIRSNCMEFEEIGHMLAFSESDDEGDQELLRLNQQQEQILQQQHQQQLHRHHSQVHLQPQGIARRINKSPNGGFVSISSMPALGYRSYQPDVIKSIFR